MDTELQPSQTQFPTGYWRKRLDALADRQRFRTVKTVVPVAFPQIALDGRAVVDFSSNDYLGFAHHPALMHASIEATQRYGTGSGGSRLINGTLDLHNQLETTVAQWKGTASALVYNSGYQANVGILSALTHRGDVIFADKLNHASLVDGALLSRAQCLRYPHLDLALLEKLLQDTPAKGQRFIVSDTVFSMDGDCAPLAELYALACRYEAWLILDEAHASGVFGAQKRSGLWETTDIGPADRVIQIGTFSKALGSFGAYVAASQDIIDTLVNTSRSFIYSTALPPGVIAANQQAIQLLMDDPGYTNRLWDNINRMGELLRSGGFDIKPQSAVIPIVLGSDQRALQDAQRLLEAGYFIQAIRPPSVPEGTARLRLSINGLHQPQQLSALAQLLQHSLD